ncbi:arginyltransferase [Leptospira langatensis]|uniref:Arginyltransferase n=1 Tax=Leptospira langatensis TaxID=2484983 RepID=A0A5F1ZRK1_9LEPT|nr:arginyltransferase [Leptospira langatensis]TGK05526.1 arginyltransferase [Leptospira langatensis]TGL38662.1 arginyltransferase [Leptospira langatensis]
MQIDYFEFLDSLPTSPDSACSYYPERISRIKGFAWKEKIAASVLDFLFRFGFRRSGNFYYRTDCPNCSHCLSYRIPLHTFSPNANQKRIQRKNADLRITVSSPEINSEKKSLYSKYQRSRHEGYYGDSEEELVQAMRMQMYDGSGNSREIQIHTEERLLGWMLLDLGKETVSALYSVFDPEEEKRSLGNFLILSAILWAKNNGFLEFHLGLYLPNHPKMDYKSKWKPAEILEKKTGVWEKSEIFLPKYFDLYGREGNGPTKG